ncbi:hypothetical protein FB45DRAFT_868425 [Roridomyces roridus]|uniref:Uncharacterized protein n=1 Tax=Roridomyces roridus TaxID=1738132 RepID=A0AAD7FLY9_9AGAR|nr:hypothetical protein FB45DRAFT_868425 [Roridomyces roridus]
MLLGQEAHDVFFNGTQPSKPICTPRFFESEGYNDREDPVYLVAVGAQDGIFTDVALARDQTDHYPDSQLRVRKTWVGPKGAKIVWLDLCLKYHARGCPNPTGFPEGFSQSSPFPNGITMGPTIAVTPSVSYNTTCGPNSSSCTSSPCPSLVNAPASDDGNDQQGYEQRYAAAMDDERYDERYATLAAAYDERHAAAILAAGPNLFYDVQDLKELSSLFSTMSSPSRRDRICAAISSPAGTVNVLQKTTLCNRQLFCKVSN